MVSFKVPRFLIQRRFEFLRRVGRQFLSQKGPPKPQAGVIKTVIQTQGGLKFLNGLVRFALGQEDVAQQPRKLRGGGEGGGGCLAFRRSLGQLTVPQEVSRIVGMAGGIGLRIGNARQKSPLIFPAGKLHPTKRTAGRQEKGAQPGQGRRPYLHGAATS